jgi:hypothetical protein
VIAMIAVAGAVALFKVAQRSKITPGELDRTTVTAENQVARLGQTAAANA